MYSKDTGPIFLERVMNGQKGTRGAGCARAHRQGASEPARSVSEAVWGMF